MPRRASTYSSPAAAAVAAAAFKKMEASIAKTMSPEVEYDDQRSSNLSSLSSRSNSKSDSHNSGVGVHAHVTPRPVVTRKPSRKSVTKSKSATKPEHLDNKTSLPTDKSNSGFKPKPRPSTKPKAKSKPLKRSSMMVREGPQSQLQSQNPHPHSPAIPLLASGTPTSSASSSDHRLNILVCTANLGNAPPDADSWDAWIPKDGKLVMQTKFPVRMDLPPAPPAKANNKPPQSQTPPMEQLTKTNSKRNLRRASAASPALFGQNHPPPPTNRRMSHQLPLRSTMRTAARTKSEEQIRIPEPLEEESEPANNDDDDGTTNNDASYQAFLRSLQNPESSIPENGAPNQQVQQPKQPPRLTREGSKRRVTPPRTKSLPSKVVVKNNQGSASASASGINGGGGGSGGATKPNKASKRQSVLETTKDELLALASAAASSLAAVQQANKQNNASAASATPLDQVSSHPAPPPAVIGAELFEFELGRELVDVVYPTSDPLNSDNNNNGVGCYDIVVIGMQEATFSMDKLGKMSKKDKKAKDGDDEAPNLISPTIPTDEGTAYDTEDFETDSDNDDGGASFGNATTDDSDSRSLASSTMVSDANEAGGKPAATAPSAKPSKQRKSIMHKLVKPLKQITKATTKTARTVNEFAGSGKNHTLRKQPGMAILPSASESPPEEDPGQFSDDEEEDDNDNDHYSTIDEEDGEDSDDESVASSKEADPRKSAEAPGTTSEEAAAAAAKSGKKWTDTDFLHHGLETQQLRGYTRALSYQFGQMRLLIYYKSEGTDSTTDENRINGVVKSLEVLSVTYQGTGKAGLANKGGIVAEVEINKTTRLSFLTAHLEAHEGEKHYRARNDSFKDILMETSSSKFFDASQSSHFTFFMGDLNYRTNLPEVPLGSERHIRLCHNMVNKHAWRTLNKYDELRKSLEKQTCLVGFQTAYCNFPPTFKVGRNDGYVYNVKRSPSYTDRILFKACDKTLESAVNLVLYEPIQDFVSSDHKPIRGGFSIKLNRQLRWKSTAQLLLEGRIPQHQGDALELMMSEDSHQDAGGNQSPPRPKRKSRKTKASAEEHNVLEGIIPNTTTGDIATDRESMHFLVTNIQCSIIPHKYDYIRKQEKAEMPIPKLMFLPDPRESIMPLEEIDEKPKGLFQQLNFGKRKDPAPKKLPTFLATDEDFAGPDFTAPETSGSKKSPKYPSTLSAKETMRPTWRNIDDHVHFALQTHTEEGRPIDFTGAHLHLSLVDSKAVGGALVIGSHCLNLAHLIIVSRDKSQTNKVNKSPKATSKRLQKPTRTRSGRLQETKSRESIAGSSGGTKSTDHPPLEHPAAPSQQRPGPPNRSLSNRSNLGYYFTPQPSPALRSIAAALSSPSVYKAFGTGKKGGDDEASNSQDPKVRAAVKKAAEFIQLKRSSSLRKIGARHSSSPIELSQSSSNLFQSIIDDLGGDAGGDRDTRSTTSGNHVNGEVSASCPQANQRKQQRKNGLDEFGIKSLRLREALYEGGLVVGHINCDIDIWWM